jgi:hypothetical protein
MVLCWAFLKNANLSLRHNDIIYLHLASLLFFLKKNIISIHNPLAEKTERGLYLKRDRKKNVGVVEEIAQ